MRNGFVYILSYLKGILKFFGTSVLLLACYESKVDRLRLELMEQQLIALENWQRELNGNIVALQQIVNSLNTGKYIASVAETGDGYTIVLSDHTSFQLYHGRKGEDGDSGKVVMPLISVRDSSDGHVYWTMDGKIVTNTDGEALRADGVKGESGEQGGAGAQGSGGRIPRVRINPVTDVWEISSDEGQSWQSTGIKATGDRGETGSAGPQGPPGTEGGKGPEGDGVFAADGVKIQDTYVDFILADGRVIRLPRQVEWTIEFPGGMAYQASCGGQIQIRFAITGYGGNPVVDAAGDQGWLAEVWQEEESSLTGEIRLVAPQKPGMGKILVVLSNGDGRCRTYVLSVSSY